MRGFVYLDHAVSAMLGFFVGFWMDRKYIYYPTGLQHGMRDARG